MSSENDRPPSHSFRLRRAARPPAVPKWRTAEAEARFRRLEEELWSRSPSRPDATQVETSFGTSHVYRWPGHGDPLVLLHGMGATSVIWTDFIGRFAGRDIYAIDTMGDVGRSAPTQPIAHAGDSAEWLRETFNGLGLEAAHLIGYSYGGWLALNLAIRHPSSALSLTLLEPAGLATLEMGRFLVMGLKVVGAMLLPARLRKRASVRLGMPMLMDRRQMRMGLIGQIHHPFGLPLQVPLNSELQAVSARTLLLLGARSEVHRSDDVFARLKANLPQLQGEVLSKVGHSLPVDPRAGAARRTAVFLEGLSARDT